MCLGIPMRVIETDGFRALCEGMGVKRWVNTFLLDGVEAGAWLLVSGQTARAMLDEEEARKTTALLLEISSLS